jgi:hypothetical protein
MRKVGYRVKWIRRVRISDFGSWFLGAVGGFVAYCLLSLHMEYTYCSNKLNECSSSPLHT